MVKVLNDYYPDHLKENVVIEEVNAFIKEENLGLPEVTTQDNDFRTILNIIVAQQQCINNLNDEVNTLKQALEDEINMLRNELNL